jgi:hypothetical protein
MSLTFPYPVSSGTTFQSGQSPVYIYNGSYWTIDKTNHSTSGTSGSNGSSGTSGAQGPAGETLTVKGVYPSYSGLTGLTPTNLDTYIVQDTSHLWIYNPSSPSANGGGWVDMGQIQGPKGDSGTSGSSGSNGSSGTSGSSGGTGSSGSSGTSGSNGTSGTSGSNGTNGSSGSNGSSGTSGSNGTNGSSGTSGSNGTNGSSGTSGSNGTNGSSGTSGTSGLVTLTGTTAGGLITYNGSGTNATVQSGVTYSGTTLTAPTGSFSNVIVNGQPTTYGVANPAYAYVYLNTNTSYTNSAFDMVFDTIGTSNGITYNTSTGLFSLTAGVTYEFETNIYVQFEGGVGYVAQYQWVDSSNNELSPTQGQSIPVTSGFNDSGTSSQSLIYTPSQNMSVKVRWINVYGGRLLIQGIKTWAKVKQINPTIAIQSTATGTMNKNFIKYTRTASQSVSGNTVVICNVLESSSGNIISPNTSTGQITLTSGKTYRLRGTVGTMVGSTAASYIGYGWYNETTSAWIGEGAQIISPSSTNYNISNGGTAEVIITVNTSTIVSLRVISATNISSIGGNQSDFAGTYANPWIDIEEMGSTFALTSISGLTTTSDVNVGGNLTLTGSFQGVEPSYTFADDSASSSWYLLGTWNTVQSGQMLYMRIVSHSGYNGVANQNQITELTWAASNGYASYSGSTGLMYGAGQACANSRLGTGNLTYQAPSSFRMVQVSQTQYQVYGYFGAYTRGSSYSVQTSNLCSWVHSGLPVSAPSGNYIAISISTY